MGMNYTIKGPTIHVPEKISIRKPLLIIGSCFAENIGNFMQQQLFDVQINPFGIVYNPLSIASQLQIIVRRKEFEQSDLFHHHGLWHSWHHHGSFSDADATLVINNINKEIQRAHSQLLSSDWLLITLGTAFYYTHTHDMIVSNCHKVPAFEFIKKQATQAQITEALQEVFEQINLLNPSLKIILCVSPVRYVRDGLRENTLSKSILHLSCDEIVQQNRHCFYFPSYEIVIDELRDYRFYKEDMLHPSEQAVRYIYEKFSSSLFDQETHLALQSINELKAYTGHHPLHLSDENKKHRATKIHTMIKNLENRYPFLSARLSGRLL
jgi:hypothetical protein